MNKLLLMRYLIALLKGFDPFNYVSKALTLSSAPNSNLEMKYLHQMKDTKEIEMPDIKVKGRALRNTPIATDKILPDPTNTMPILVSLRIRTITPCSSGRSGGG